MRQMFLGSKPWGCCDHVTNAWHLYFGKFTSHHIVAVIDGHYANLRSQYLSTGSLYAVVGIGFWLRQTHCT